MKKGVTKFKDGFKFDLAMEKGTEKKQAMMFFTDWLRFRQKFGEDWQGLISNLMGILVSMMSSLMEQENQKQESILQKASLTKLKKLTKKTHNA